MRLGDQMIKFNSNPEPKHHLIPKTKRSLIVMGSASVLLLLFAILLLFSKPLKRAIIGSYQPTITAKTTKKAEQASGNFNYHDAKQPSYSDILKARQHASDIATVGVIAIPSIKVYLPIGKGVANNVLALAAGTMRADQKMGQGNYALAGHNMNDAKTLFSPVYNYAQPGQKIYLTNFRKVYVYQITNKQTIDPTQVEVTYNTDKPIITLITCNLEGTKRICVQGKLVQEYQYKQASKAVKQVLAHDYNR